MSILEFLLDRTPRITVPTVYGKFHITALFIIFCLFCSLIIMRKKLPRGFTARRYALALFGFGLLFLEVGKQIVYSYDFAGGWSYDFSRFPFQFCSTPIYIAIIAAFLPDGKLYRALLCFLGTYSPVAGCAVLFMPSSNVFSEILFLDLHTMLWHGAMLLFGLYLWLTGAIIPRMLTALQAFIVFLPLNFVALALNEAEHALKFAEGYEFNMFYFSRYFKCNIPLLNFVQAHAPYAVFFASFVMLLTLGNAAVTFAMIIIERIQKKPCR